MKKLILYTGPERYSKVPGLINEVCKENRVACQTINNNFFFDHQFSVHLENNRPRVRLHDPGHLSEDDLCWVCAYPGEYDSKDTEDYLATEKNAQIVAFLGSFQHHINKPDLACPAWSSHSLSQVTWCCNGVEGLYAPPVAIGSEIKPGWVPWPWFQEEAKPGLPITQYRLDDPSKPLLVINIGASHLAIELESRRQAALSPALSSILSNLSALLQCAYFEIVIAQDKGNWFLFDLRIFPHYINTIAGDARIKSLLTTLIMHRV